MDTIINPSPAGRARRAKISADIDAHRPPVAYTIAEFCYTHKISPAYYYKQRKLGLGPREMVVGRRRIISTEAAAAWRQARAADEPTSAT